ncbi:SURF1 family protein [Massilia sp. CFBP9012]|uniref:SURF1 family protein n=1 Tax=Massilia sp. CFBP9012 TaxID=3096531 RepID=UPI002A6A9623|nr:SURF1 family protein [Massilia sp. CFBP9012]MDY0974021.1 SURF1 family protein [Massilia sp. CFBP9012]
MRFGFRFRPVAFAAALVVAIIGILLGNWQQGRAAYKTELQARQLARAAEPLLEITPSTMLSPDDEFRTVRLQGEFVAGWPVFLANRPMGSQSGFYLAMPFKIAGSDTHVLVLRGWLPRPAGAEYGKLPAFATPAGPLLLKGRIVSGAGKVMDLGEGPPLTPGAMVQNLTPEALAAASGLKLQPFLVQQTQAAGRRDALARNWPAPDAGIDKHRGYAFQWYALAALALLFYVITGFRRGSRTNR